MLGFGRGEVVVVMVVVKWLWSVGGDGTSEGVASD